MSRSRLVRRSRVDNFEALPADPKSEFVLGPSVGLYKQPKVYGFSTEVPLSLSHRVPESPLAPLLSAGC